MDESGTTLGEITAVLRHEIEAALARYLDAAHTWPTRLREAMRHSLLAPGKRLRPLLVLLAAKACGQDSPAAMPVGCAVEMVHTYSLIHDDLPAMDDDDLRRGRPTCHRAFDEATAILAGDALLTYAFELIATDVHDARIAATCCRELAAAAGPSGMVGGQQDDMDHETTPCGLGLLESIHRRKTGALIRASLRLGGVCAGANDAQVASLSRFGEGLGLAFQIVDDLLDVTGDEQAMGKRLQKDGSHGKSTFPAIMGIHESRRRATAMVDDAVGALAPLGEAAQPLRDLARSTLTRVN